MRPLPLFAAAALASASCDIHCGAHRAAPEPKPLAPPAAAAPAPITYRGLDSIKDPTIADAFRAWAERRASGARRPGVRLGYRIVSADFTPFTNVAGGRVECVVRARVAEGVECAEEIVIVKLTNDPSAPPVTVEAGSLGEDCCDDIPCPDRPALGYMLDLTRALATKDVGAFARLVDPKSGIEIVLRMVGEGESDEDTRRFRADQAKEAMRGLSTIQLTGGPVSCGAFDSGGTASCSAFGGGWEAHYAWHRTQSGVYLVSVREKSH